MSRFVFMMLDGVGVGELPDAADYGDTGSDTLGNLARTVSLQLPNLRRLGLGNIIPIWACLLSRGRAVCPAALPPYPPARTPRSGTGSTWG